MPHARPLFGLLVLIAVAWLLSSDRRRFPVRTVVAGVLLQLVLAYLLLNVDAGIAIFQAAADLVMLVFAATMDGAEFVFGQLVEHDETPWGFIFAVRALPAIIVFSSLSAIGYHFGLLQRAVMGMAWAMRRTLRISGAESLSAAGNVFLGQTEAPLLVRPYLQRATRSELNAIMVGGFATVQGSLVAVYADLLGLSDPDAVAQFARHLLTASLISAPAGVVVAKIMLPERDTPDTAGGARLDLTTEYRNGIDAAAAGATDGLKLALNVAAMLIAFLALIALLDRGLAALSPLFGQVIETLAPGPAAPPVPGAETAAAAAGGPWISADRPLSVGRLLGWLFWPVAWLIGIRVEDCAQFGSLLGLSMATNEFVAYTSLRETLAAGTLDPRSANLAVYALCGFANFGSIAIQLGGISGMAPTRRADLATLGLRAMLGGAMACWLTACVAALMT